MPDRPHTWLSVTGHPGCTGGSMPVRLVITTYAQPGKGAEPAQAMADRCRAAVQQEPRLSQRDHPLHTLRCWRSLEGTHDTETRVR